MALWATCTEVWEAARNAQPGLDLQAGKSEWLAGGGSPTISGDGRFVAFASSAANLAPGDTNGRTDVFVAERG